MNQTEPVSIARSTMKAMSRGDRDAWIKAFADDAVLEDPVGQAPMIEGHSGLSQFWDQARSNLESVDFDITRAWEGGSEAMLLATVTIATPAGQTATYDGAFNYRVSADGKIASMRGFWNLADVAAALSS